MAGVLTIRLAHFLISETDLENYKVSHSKMLPGVLDTFIGLYIVKGLVQLRTGFGSLGMNPPSHCRNLTKLGVQ